MTNNKKLFSFIIILFILLAAVTTGIVYFAYNITKFTTFSPDTVVGNLYIGGMYGDEAKKALDNQVEKWNEDGSIMLVYQGYEIELDKNKFEFDTGDSINQVKNGRTVNLVVTLNDENYIKDIINQNQNTLKFSDFNIPNLESAILMKVSSLYTTIKIDLEKYVNTDKTSTNLLKTVSLNYADANFLVGRIDYYVQTIEIPGNKQFSLNDTISSSIQNILIEKEDNSEFKFTDKEMSVIATGIYNLILDTNFVNIEKYISSSVPSYTQAGYEALSSPDYNLDLSFYNPNGYAYYVTISYDQSNNNLVFKLYGAPFVDSITHQDDLVVLQPFDVFWYYDTWENQPVDQPIKVQTGKVGYRNKVYRVITKRDGTTEKTLISEDVYMQTPNIFVDKKPTN